MGIHPNTYKNEESFEGMGNDMILEGDESQSESSEESLELSVLQPLGQVRTLSKAETVYSNETMQTVLPAPSCQRPDCVRQLAGYRPNLIVQKDEDQSGL